MAAWGEAKSVIFYLFRFVSLNEAGVCEGGKLGLEVGLPCRGKIRSSVKKYDTCRWQEREPIWKQDP